MLMHWDFALILIFFAVAVPLLGRRRIRQLLLAPDTTRSNRLRLYASTIAFQWIAASLILWRARAHGYSNADLAFAVSKPALTIIIAAGLCGLVLANQIFSLKQIALHPDLARGRLQQVALRIFPRDNGEKWVFVCLVTTVAICEEVIFRGFFQRLFENWLLGFVVAGVVGSAVMFSLSHLYQGRRGLLSTLVVGVIFAGIRAWTGSLAPCICAHFAADLVVGLRAPNVLRKSVSQSSDSEALSI